MMNRLKDALPDWFQRTRVGQDAIAELEGELATERETHVAAIKDAEARRTKELPAVNTALEKAEADVEKARAALKDAEARARKAYAARGSVIRRAEAVIRQHEAALVETADPRIDAFKSKLHDLFYAEVRQPLLVQHEQTGLHDNLSRRPIVLVSNNAHARLELLNAIRSGMGEADALRHSPKHDVAEHLRAIFDNLPSGDALAVIGEVAEYGLGGQTVKQGDWMAKFSKWMETGLYSEWPPTREGGDE